MGGIRPRAWCWKGRRPRRPAPSACRRARAERPRRGRGPPRRLRLRGLPHGPAALRGRPGGAAPADRPRPPGRGPGRGGGPGRPRLARGRPRRRLLARGRRRHLPLLPRGPREPLRARGLHRLGPRRRVRRAHARRAGRVRRAAARGPRRRAVAPLLCGGVIGYRALRLRGVAGGGRLGLYGFGASALCTIQVAVHMGCEVYVATRSERERAARASSARSGPAATRTGRPSRSTPPSRSRPSGDVVAAALAAVDRGGDRRGQRHPPRPPPRDALRDALVGALDPQRRQRHARRRRRVPRAGRRDPGADRRPSPTRSRTPTSPWRAWRPARCGARPCSCPSRSAPKARCRLLFFR